MRKYFAIVIMICLGILFFINFSNTTSKDKFDKSILSNEDKLLKNLHEDYEDAILKIRELQNNPKQVVDLNNMIMQKLYSNTVSDQDTELLLNAQRQLYDEELLKTNPKDIHFQRAKEEIKTYNNSNTKILGYHSQKDESSGTDEMVFIKVVYYLNKTGNEGQVYQEYLLIKDKNLWKIKGWQKIDEFIVVGD